MSEYYGLFVAIQSWDTPVTQSRSLSFRQVRVVVEILNALYAQYAQPNELFLLHSISLSIFILLAIAIKESAK